MAFLKESDRQYPLTAVVEISYSDLVSGVALPVAEVPNDAVVTGGQFVVTEVFDSATSDTVTVGDADDDDEYKGGINAQSAGTTALVPTGHQYASNTDLVVKWTGVGTAPTQGKALLIVEYVRQGRQNENQG